MEQNPMNRQIWYEDFTPGEAITSPPRRITVADIESYAALTGETHPVHMDYSFAQSAGFRGRIAHGLFSLALIEGLKSATGIFEQSVTASLGWDNVRFNAPLYPDDEVHLRLEFVSRRMTSKPGRGIATERGILLKSDGTEAVRGDHLIFLMCRPEGGTGH